MDHFARGAFKICNIYLKERLAQELFMLTESLSFKISTICLAYGYNLKTVPKPPSMKMSQV